MRKVSGGLSFRSDSQQCDVWIYCVVLSCVFSCIVHFCQHQPSGWLLRPHPIQRDRPAWTRSRVGQSNYLHSFTVSGVCVFRCLQVLADLSSYDTKSQSGYNPPVFVRPRPMPEPLPPVGPPAPPGGPVGPPAAPGGPGGPRAASRRKRSAMCFRCWWPYFSGGTNTDEVFSVSVARFFALQISVRVV